MQGRPTICIVLALLYFEWVDQRNQLCCMIIQHYGSREGQFPTADDPTEVGPDMPDDRARHARRSGPTCPTSLPPTSGSLSGPTSGRLSGPTSGRLSGRTSGRLSGRLSGLHDQPPMILQWTINEDHQP